MSKIDGGGGPGMFPNDHNYCLSSACQPSNTPSSCPPPLYDITAQFSFLPFVHHDHSYTLKQQPSPDPVDVDMKEGDPDVEPQESNWCFGSKNTVDDQKVRVPNSKSSYRTPVDRYALYTDGSTCWNPPLAIFQTNYAHPIPNLQLPPPIFRDYYRSLMIEFVHESVMAGLEGKAFSRFEQRFLAAGVDLREIEIFRDSKFKNEIVHPIFAKKDSKQRKKMNWNEILAICVDIKKWHESYKGMKDSNVEDLLKRRGASIDWLFVSAKMRTLGHRSISASNCKRMWNNKISESISKPRDWSQQDFSKFKALTKRPKLDFERIAECMGRGTTPYLCYRLFVNYYRKPNRQLHDMKKCRNLWSRNEVQRKFRLGMEIYNGSLRMVGQWLSRRYGVNFTKQFLRYAMLGIEKKKGPFTNLEDVLGIVADEILTSHDHEDIFQEIEEILWWRSGEFWQNRIDALRYPHYATTGALAQWSESEDMLLLNLVKKKKYKNDWVAMKEKFQNPRRNRKQILSRWFHLSKVLKNQSLKQYHETRKKSHVSTPYFYLRKSLAYLEEIEKEGKNSNSGSLHPSTRDAMEAKGVFENFFQFCDMRRRAFSGKFEFPTESDLLELLVRIPRVYVRRAATKIREFFSLMGKETIPMHSQHQGLRGP